MRGTINERAKTHGAFEDNAAISQELKATMRSAPNFYRLSAVHRQSLENIADKIARVLSGNANFDDHWHDIAGYAFLAEAHCDPQKNLDLPKPATPPVKPGAEEEQRRPCARYLTDDTAEWWCGSCGYRGSRENFSGCDLGRPL